jgi:DNA-binding response OmpR family regulator
MIGGQGSSSSEVAPPDRPMSEQKLRILIVEDHVDTAFGLKMYFTNLGHDVQVALDVKSARETAARYAFDILLSDLALPDGTGWDLLRDLKASGPVRAIALSGYNSPEDIARSEAAGFRMHLSKPFAMRELDRIFAETMKE